VKAASVGLNPAQAGIEHVPTCQASSIQAFPDLGTGKPLALVSSRDRRQGAREAPHNTSTGTETTLGLPQAVEIRIVRDGNCSVCVKMLLTTATTLPSQSSTGAPDAP
jgi:hypothetical protein